MLSVYLADRLGWYRSLAQDGPATTPTNSPSARRRSRDTPASGASSRPSSGSSEWPTAAASCCPPARPKALTDVDSLAYFAPMARIFGAVGPQLAELLDAYRTGDGVSWDELGADAREAQADLNRPWFLHRLPEALGSSPELDTIHRRPGARILDVGCGAGWSSIALAQAYPTSEILGVDIDAPSIEMARRHAAGLRT